MDASEDIVLRANGMEFTATSCGSGPIVLCLHGFPDHRGTFRHQLPALAAAGYRAIAPTIRGYEPSSQPTDGDYHVVRMVEDVVAWIDALGEERVHLVGHDWGAVVAYATAAHAPERLHSLTTLAVPHMGNILFSRELFKVAAQVRKPWYMLFFQLRVLPELALRRNDWALIERLWRDWSPGWSPPASELASVKRSLAQPGVLNAALSYYRSLPGTGTAARNTRALQVQPIHVPTLAMTGARDGCMDTRLYDLAMRRELFTSELAIERLDDAGHFLHQECPEEVHALLLPWLQRHDSPRHPTMG